MTGRSWKITWWVVGVVTGLIIAGVGVFFVVTGVEDANRWSGVLGFFVGIAGLVVAVYSAVLTRRSSTPAGEPSTGGDVTNTISGGTFHQPIVQGRDISGLSLGPADSGTGPTPGGGATP